VEVTDSEISEIKINSVPKKQKKTRVRILKQLFASGSVIIAGIFTSTSSRRILPDNHLAFGE
jgi:hypothetical protein